MQAADPPVHHFFSELLEREVLDNEGTPVGDLFDIAFATHGSYPRATHLIVRRGLFHRSYAAIPWERLEKLSLNFNLDIAAADLSFEPLRPIHDFSIVRDILDKQVVDTNGQKVIRVNDVRLLQLGNELRLQQVDVGLRGLIRRLGWQWWVDPFVEVFLARTDYLNDHVIGWNFIQPLAINTQKGTLKLTIDQKQLAMIPHADFRELFLNMDAPSRVAMFKSMPVEVKPRIYSEIDLELQKELLDHLDLGEAAGLLSKIPADQTTDLLEELPKSLANSLLAMMETTTARRLSTLLGYTSDSAGGLMTTEMLTAPSSATVADVLERLKSFSDIESLYHVYLVDADNRLMGQVLLKRLLLASPSDPVFQFVYPKPRYVRAKDTLREVAFVMEKYKTPAIPVVDNGRDRHLQGVITMDDILAKLIPLAWRRASRRPPQPPAEAA
ncbi:MAG: magnesium transporter [Elusimicrobia bacterium]|nr:magnesium transporter [Elusimicrobiota bacterium]